MNNSFKIEQAYEEHKVFQKLNIYSSIQETLNSINDILIKGRINDAYALLRKYYDSTIINIYTNLYLRNEFSFENLLVEKIDNWMNGKDQLPEFRVMSNYIRNSQDLKNINDLLYKDKIYKQIRGRCNDHTHYNFFKNVMLNNCEINFTKDLTNVLNVFLKDLENIFLLHFVNIFTVNDHYMMSSDYMDSLDFGQTPEEGSEYFVAKFIQDIFNNEIKVLRMDIAMEIKNNSLMKLE